MRPGRTGPADRYHGRVFGKKKKAQEDRPDPAQESVRESPTRPHDGGRGTTPGKGRPTPSRKEQEAARRRPLVPQDRKAAKEANREAAREARILQNQAMQTGDERYLPARDRGPQRRFARDFVDSRRNIGDFFIVVLLILFIGSMFLPAQQPILVNIMWILILVWIIDTWLMWRKLKSRLVEKFTTVQQGSAWYAWNRAMMIRRLRLPKPQVRHGERPA